MFQRTGTAFWLATVRAAGMRTVPWYGRRVGGGAVTDVISKPITLPCGLALTGDSVYEKVRVPMPAAASVPAAETLGFITSQMRKLSCTDWSVVTVKTTTVPAALGAAMTLLSVTK